MPERIRLSRAKGWRKPAGAVVVSRPSRWGNPFTIEWARIGDDKMPEDRARAMVVSCYRWWLTDDAWASQFRSDVLPARRTWILEHLHELTGKDLCCWCYLDHSCHADVLMEMANTWQYGVRGFVDIAHKPVDIPMPEANARQCIKECYMLGHQQPKTLVRRVALGPWVEVPS